MSFTPNDTMHLATSHAISDETAALMLCAEGAALSEAGNTTGAIECYTAAIAKAPAVLELYLVLANAQLLAGDELGARGTLQRALRHAARADAASEFTLGKALVEAGAGAAAVSCFRRVRAEHPNDGAAASALAASLREAQQPDDAWTQAAAALALNPDDPATLLTASLIRHDLGDLPGALALCEQSLTLRPNSPGTRVTRGYLRHLLGDARGGWSDFESRARPAPDTSALQWQGESLQGHTITVIGEQGAGDQFQFLRFVQHPLLRAATRVIVTCQPEAVALLQAAGFDAVARNTPVQTDFWTALLSLPLLLDVDADWRAPDAQNYIDIPDVTRRASPRVQRVGVVWAGNPLHRNDAVRSIPASLLHALLRTHPKVTFVCMQPDADRDDIPAAAWEKPHLRDWLATARELCTLDMLMTVDTGIAHLAGALGIPVWIMLPHVPDWRWGMHGNTTPWYPAARIFRQPARGDWSRVLTNVSAALSGAELGPL